MRLVLDASAIVALIRNEPGADRVEALLLDESNECQIHPVNLSEVYYLVTRGLGEVVAQEAIKKVRDIGVDVPSSIDDRLWMEAGRIKAFKAVPLGDSYAAALAATQSATVVTTDRGDFTPLEQDGTCKVLFVR